MAKLGKEIGKAVDEKNGFRLLRDLQDSVREQNEDADDDDDGEDFPFEIEEKPAKQKVVVKTNKKDVKKNKKFRKEVLENQEIIMEKLDVTNAYLRKIAVALGAVDIDDTKKKGKKK